ncbi:MAG: hypothetical protein K2I14_08520, partial [Eubacterium sp.]|nr:hypothetical protein [Eubacterium sp.]
MQKIIDYNTKRNNEVLKLMNDTSLCPIFDESNVGVSNYTKLPLSRLAAFGTAFQPFATEIQTAISNVGGSGLYYVNTDGKTMFQMKGTSNFIGSLKTPSGTVGGGQAKMIQLAYDPVVLFMAAAFANIQKSLDDIKKMQQEMIEFLIQKEKSELKGSLTFLFDVFNNYKFNWNNKMYKNGNHIKVLDIRQMAESKIVFYREQIISKVNQKSLLHSAQSGKQQLKTVQD